MVQKFYRAEAVAADTVNDAKIQNFYNWCDFNWGIYFSKLGSEKSVFFQGIVYFVLVKTLNISRYYIWS